MRTRLELSNGVSLGLSDEIAYSITYSIADIREPDKRNGSFSKTITIPSSKEADIFFKGAFEIDGYDNYNTNKKADCTIYVDDFEQLIGTLQLLKINITDTSITYEVALKGNVSNIFIDAGDKYLTDIDFSDLNHEFNKANQIASWSATVGSGYIYPMIDYGYTNAHEFDVNNFFPAIYLKEYIDKIFNYLGYKYSSNFFNTEFFKRLIVPASIANFKLTNEQMQERMFRAYNDSDLTYNFNSTPDSYLWYRQIHNINFTFPFNNETYDFSNQFNTSNYKYTNIKAGNYIFKSNFTSYINFSIPLDTVGGDIVTAIHSIKRIRNGVVDTLAVSDILYYDWFPTYTGLSNALPIYIETPITYLEIGDIVYCETKIQLNLSREIDDFGNPIYPFHSYSDYEIRIDENGLFLNDVISEGVVDGDDLDVNATIPINIKIKDFLKWIVQVFNLYIDIDKQNEKTLYIEPRNEFYNNGVTLDWTNKLIVDKQLTITPMGQLNAIRYIYSYKTDSDYWSKKYFDKWQETFGTENYLVDNDFLKNENKTEIGFTNTISAKIDGTDRVIPQIVDYDNEKGIIPFKKANIRLLYFGGLKETTTSWKYTSFISGDSNETQYPYTGHLDDVITPTIDLSFGVPKEVYYIATAYTNNNLFNRFHKKFIEEITDKDSKIVTCYLNLSPVDIYHLDFRNQYYIDGHLLRLNKIMDYNPISNEPTKCEFIKIKDANDFVPTEIDVPPININDSPYL